MGSLKINNSKDKAVKTGKWSNPGAKFYDTLLDSFYCEGDLPADSKELDKKIKDGNYIQWNDFLKEAYLIAPIKDIKNSPYGVTPFSRSGCKYPHHEIRNGELVLSVPGVKAAYARAKQQGVYKGELKEHLDHHIKELGVLVNFEEKIESNFDDIYGYILERTGIDLFDDINEDFMESSEEVFTEKKTVDESIQESFDWIENFVYNEECRDQYLQENNYQVMMSRTNPQELMTWMKANIRYGWRSSEDDRVHGTDEEDDENYFYKYYRLQSPVKLAENKVGVCWDQCELERQWFSKNGIEHGIFYIELQDEQCLPTHTFLVYHMHDGYWWFEHSWGNQMGIRKYDDLKSLILDAVIKHQIENNDRTSPVYVSWLKEPPSFGITCEEYMNYAHSQVQLDVNNLPSSFNENINESYFVEEIKIDNDSENDEPPSLPGEEENPDSTTEETSVEEPASEEKPTTDEPPEIEDSTEEETPIEDQPVEEEEPVQQEEQPKKEEPVKKEEPKPESLPKQTDKAESSKNGVRRKKLYIAFIEWCKEYNNKNTFGSIFDKDAFKVSYPFVPDEMRYFYRLANPMLCVLSGDLTFFPVAELRKLNSKNSKLDELMIFAATPNDLRVFNKKDKKVYRATEENGAIKLAEVLGDTYDTYIQKMINKGDILNGPIEESVNIPFIW